MPDAGTPDPTAWAKRARTKKAGIERARVFQARSRAGIGDDSFAKHFDGNLKGL
jgi:hypothetical protein